MRTSTPQPGMRLADGADDQGEELGAAVLTVVAIDAGDDGELQAHGFDGFGDALGLVIIDGERGDLSGRRRIRSAACIHCPGS